MAGRNIKGITVEIGGDTTKLQTALKGVNSEIKSTQAQLKDVEKLLKLDPSNTELLAQKQKLLSQAITETKDKLGTLKTASEQANEQLSKGAITQEQYDALQREIQETEQALKKLEDQASQTNITLAKIDEIGGKFQEVGDGISNVGKGLSKTVTAPIVAIGTAAVKVTADFDQQMSKVSAIAGATGKDFDDLRAKAREMGAKTKFSATESAQAFEYMAMAGWKTGDMLDGIEGIMSLAAASGEDLATTSDIVTDALTAFGLKASDSGHFADILAAASSNANTNVSMLGESFKYAAPVAGSLGISAEDTSIALGLMANAGIKASQAGTNLRTGLTNLAKPTKQMQSYMDKYNIALVTNKDGSINLRKTMISLRQKMGDLSESEQAAAAAAIFGKNSMAGWLSIINASDDDFNKLTNAIDNCDGVAEHMAETMQDNLNGQITILKSALQDLMIEIGDALMPTIRKIVSAIQAFVEKIKNMDERTKGIILRVALFAAALGPALVVVGKVISTVGTALKGFSAFGKGILKVSGYIKNAGGIFGILKKAIMSIFSPVGIVIGVVATLAGAFITLWKNNEKFREKITAIWNHLVKNFQHFVKRIVDRINSLGFNFTSIVDVLKSAWEGFCNFLAPIFIAVFRIIHNILTGAMNTIIAIIDVFIGIFQGDWNKVWDGAKRIVSNVWKTIQTVITDAVRIVKRIVNGFLSLFGTDWDTVWEGCKNTVSTIWNGITTVFQNAKDTVTRLWGNIGRWFTERWEAIKSAFPNVTAFFRNKFDGAAKIVKKVWDGIKSFFTNLWTSITTDEGLKGIIDNLSKPFTDAWDTAKKIWDDVATYFTSLWTSVTTADGLQGVLSALSKPFTDAWDAIKGVWDTVSTFFSGIFSGFTTDESLTGVQTTISNPFTGAWDTIKEKFNGFTTTFLEWFGTIDLSAAVAGVTSWVSNAWTTISTQFTNAGETIKGWFGTIDLTEAVSGVSSWVSDAWTTITGKFENVGTTIKDWFGTIDVSTAVAGVSSWVANAYTTITGKFENIGITISSWFSGINISEYVANVSSWCADGWNTIKTTFENAATDIVGFFSGMSFEDVKTTVSGWASTAWDNIKLAFNTVLTFFTDDVVGNIKKPFEGIATWFSDTFSGAWKAVTDLFGDVGEWAAGVWNGIKNGIQSASEWVSNAASATGAWITQAGVDVGDFFKDGWENGWGLWGNKEPSPISVEVETQGVEEAKSSVEAFKEAIEGVATTNTLDTWYSSQFEKITEIVKNGSATITQLLTELKTGFETATENIKTGMDALDKRISTSINNVKIAIQNVLGNIPNSAYTWGVDICSMLAQGIYDNADQATKAATYLADSIKKIIGFSVPETGPLSDADTYMPDFMDLMAKGVKGSKHTLLDSIKSLAGSVNKAFSGLTTPTFNPAQLAIAGNTGTTTNNRTVNVGGLQVLVNGYKARNDQELAYTLMKTINEEMNKESAAWGL